MLGKLYLGKNIEKTSNEHAKLQSLQETNNEHAK